eukprot:5221987-Pyramimonas_sp.AAC.1
MPLVRAQPLAQLDQESAWQPCRCKTGPTCNFHSSRRFQTAINHNYADCARGPHHVGQCARAPREQELRGGGT